MDCINFFRCVSVCIVGWAIRKDGVAYKSTVEFYLLTFCTFNSPKILLHIFKEETLLFHWSVNS